MDRTCYGKCLTDAIIGNPPFLGSQFVRGSMGDDYVEWLGRRFGVGIKDYCVYWFRRAHDHLHAGQRAGLVGTNSIAQNRARSASLDYVVGAGGVITDAVSSQKWPGEAKVHVALVNWVKEPVTPPAAFTLDGSPVPGITAGLTAPGASAAEAVTLAANKGRCFQGPIPVGAGFILNEATAQWLLTRSDAEYADVVRPYLVSEDVADQPDQKPSRWIIDFALMAGTRTDDCALRRWFGRCRIRRRDGRSRSAHSVSAARAEARRGCLGCAAPGTVLGDGRGDAA